MIESTRVIRPLAIANAKSSCCGPIERVLGGLVDRDDPPAVG